MKVYENEETGEQKDLFSELIQDTTNPSATENDKGRKLTLTLNVDKVLLFILTCAIVFAVVFSYGIETGKKIKNGNDGGQLSQADVEMPENKKVLSLFPQGDKKLASKETTETATSTTVIPVAAKAIDQKQEVEKQQEVVEPLPKPVSEPATFWTIQIITYVNKTFAKEEMRKTKEKGYDCFILPSGKYYQICVGKYTTKSEANKILDKFKKQKDYSDAYIRKVDRAKIIN
ncbi:SPOR domain-containing protein [Candidatus Omnitrophota bacterium]